MARYHCLRHLSCISVGLLVLALCLCAFPASGQATSSDDPFKTLRIGAAGGMVFRDSGNPGWSPGTDVRLTVDTPYAGGRLRLDGSYRAWTGRKSASGVIDRDGTRTTADLPDVQTIDILAGWGMSNAVDAPISLDAGLLLGNRFMLFDLPNASAGRFESEMLAGPWIRIGRVTGPIRLFAEVRALRVLTQPRWDTIGVSGGVAFETSTPRWIRWILQ